MRKVVAKADAKQTEGNILLTKDRYGDASEAYKAINSGRTPTPHEIHRELGTPPQTAWNRALAENRSVLRPVPACPWWPYVWSQRTTVRVGDDGKVPVGTTRHSLDASPRSTVIRCLRPDGDIFYLRHAPNPKLKPILLLHCPVF